MREIVLDTETTGFDPVTGDRLAEIGCIELENHIPTGRNFHRYINPEREMPDAAFRIHGLSTAFLADKPTFATVADEFLAFVAEDPLVIHNAEFDMKFINFELEKSGKRAIPFQRAIDTVKMARTKFPGSPASLDALCKRFNIDNSNRTLHGALLDAQLLAARCGSHACSLPPRKSSKPMPRSSPSSRIRSGCNSHRSSRPRIIGPERPEMSAGIAG